MIVISKEHEIDFGHRVWSQELDGEFSGSIDCKCKHLHGHRGKIVVELRNEKGLEKGMVTDFNHLKKFFDWLDEVLDHKFLVDINDPAIGEHFLPKVREALIDLKLIIALKGITGLEFSKHNKGIPGLEFIENHNPWMEIYQGITIVDWVPTAENICSFLGKKIQQFLPKGIYCTSITFYETPKSKATWTA